MVHLFFHLPHSNWTSLTLLQILLVNIKYSYLSLFFLFFCSLYCVLIFHFWISMRIKQIRLLLCYFAKFFFQGDSRWWEKTLWQYLWWMYILYHILNILVGYTIDLGNLHCRRFLTKLNTCVCLIFFHWSLPACPLFRIILNVFNFNSRLFNTLFTFSSFLNRKFAHLGHWLINLYFYFGLLHSFVGFSFLRSTCVRFLGGILLFNLC